MENKGLKGSNQNAFISAEGINVSLSKNKILRSVSFNYFAGDVVGLVGRSGSGKSTILKVISGLVAPTDGALSVNNVVVWPNRPRDFDRLDYRSKVCLLMQDGGLFENLSIRANFELVVDMKLERNLRQIEAYFGEMDLDSSLLKRYPGEVSGGQRQRLALIRALLRDPEVLMLDEPTSSLDPVAARQVETAIASTINRPKITIIVSHNIDLIRRNCTVTTFVEEGAILETGPTDAVFSSQNKIIRDFVPER